MSRQLPSLILPTHKVGFLLILSIVIALAIPGQVEAVMENHFLYFPSRQLHTTPDHFDIEYRDVHFRASDGTALHGWFIPAESERPAVLFFHGNAGNISDRVDNLLQLHHAGFPVFIPDYRGYGRSAGKPSEAGTYSDARGAVAWLTEQGFPPERMIFFGRSLGAAVALQMAIENRPAALIMESPFTSVRAMGNRHYPILNRLLGWLLSAKYDNREKIARLKCPLLLIHGTDDSIVPTEMGKQLYDLAPEPKRLYLVVGADHNDGFYLHDERYWNEWNQLLQNRD